VRVEDAEEDYLLVGGVCESGGYRVGLPSGRRGL
jgi:hypothetical protein